MGVTSLRKGDIGGFLEELGACITQLELSKAS